MMNSNRSQLLFGTRLVLFFLHFPMNNRRPVLILTIFNTIAVTFNLEQIWAFNPVTKVITFQFLLFQGLL
jgi:hypothetical protein